MNSNSLSFLPEIHIREREKLSLFPPLVFRCSPGICNANCHVPAVPDDTEQGNFPILGIACGSISPAGAIHFCRNYQRYLLVHTLNLHHHRLVGLWDCWLSWSMENTPSLWAETPCWCNSGSFPAKESWDELAGSKPKSFLWNILVQLLCSVEAGEVPRGEGRGL